LTSYQSDPLLGDFQFLGQESAQRSVRFSFQSLGVQFDFDR